MTIPATSAYAKLAKVLISLPATATDLADLGMKRRSIATWLRQLRALGFVRPAGRTRAGILWTAGGRPFEWQQTSRSAQIDRFAAVCVALDRRRTAKEVSQATGIDYRCVLDIIQAVRTPQRADGSRLFRIAAWQTIGSANVALYDRLHGADAPWPAKVCRVETNARYWAKYSARRQAQQAAQA